MSLLLAAGYGLSVGGGLALANRYQYWRLPKPAHWPRLLMYHSVAPGMPSGMNMPPDKFAQHLFWLEKHGYRFCTVSELLQPATEKRVAITFDDGFANNYDYAFPLLLRHQARATIYLAPDIADIERLSAPQIRRMQDSGLIEFGAHSLRHVNLSTLTRAEALAEIAGSRDAVAALTGQPCRSFAYPFGRFNDETVALVAEAGFTSAVTTRKAITADLTVEPLRIPRISTHGDMDLAQFAVAVSRGRFRF